MASMIEAAAKTKTALLPEEELGQQKQQRLPLLSLLHRRRGRALPAKR